MFPIRLIGFLIATIAYLSGAILVVQPFVHGIDVSTLALAFLFPACLGIGLPLYAVGGQRSRELRYSGWLLLLIGLGALLGIFVDAIGVLPASQTLLLWLISPTSLFAGILLTFFAESLERHLRSTNGG